MIKDLWKYGVAYVFLYTGITTVKCMTKHMPWIGVITLVILLLYPVLLAWVNIDGLLDGEKWIPTLRFIRRRWYRFAFLWISVIFIAHQVLPLNSGNTVTITKKEMEQMVASNKQNKEKLEANLTKMLEQEYYTNASSEEKANILTQVALHEVEHLGIEAPAIKIKKIAANLGATYTPKTHQITINAMYLNDEKSVISSLLHEMYHAYQNACIQRYDGSSDLLWDRQVQVWREEYDDIHNDLESNEGLVAYYLQDCEISAREYAKERVEVYYK